MEHRLTWMVSAPLLSLEPEKLVIRLCQRPLLFGRAGRLQAKFLWSTFVTATIPASKLSHEVLACLGVEAIGSSFVFATRTSGFNRLKASFAFRRALQRALQFLHFPNAASKLSSKGAVKQVQTLLEGLNRGDRWQSWGRPAPKAPTGTEPAPF